ncbi:hypothetical protein ASPZODRAFT_134795 [Penicilliopsis zonata CBS 506.65]|uniref:SAP domain-containing protein n=1 Tax=Penicilliopsis zonata CBS 506.65 TaxID=1073090 RepID=A0A1L9SBZ7_9EURO|nr:hypothetical protein ASPZODRAFT_134795 [Penicilliopsis zonata CBS 506.65]OJJ44701.1 hypothetical protein ASPZODRAFT_134795 [Penicilliopsis zonata CBS 506.65]
MQSSIVLKSWLPALKATQLQQIAQATGIASSGTKRILIERLEAELSQTREEVESRKNDEMSILSIDMGIQNLAYAHLLVRESKPPVLNTWRRFSLMTADPADSTTTSIPVDGGDSKDEKKKKKKKKKKNSTDFSPPLYAAHAYDLTSTLLEKYHPTHILIERQRFRTGGSSAVQEWTIRVGMLEGMIYAVLHTLSKTSQTSQQNTTTPQVIPIQPQRVVRYWQDSKNKVTGREGKKDKIDRVARWLSLGNDDTATTPAKLCVGNPSVQDTVDAYLGKWRKDRKSTTAAGIGGASGIGKLDDLADCLLQGLTWLEWRSMRERLAKGEVDDTI